MIVISDCSKDIVIPAGLGDNAGVIYDVAGVKSLNGETGDLKIKTVNGNDMLGEGDIEIKGGVETVNGETGDVKIKTVNGQSLMGEGDVPVDVGVETLNGQKGDLKIKSVNGAEMLGEGNVAIDTGVESLNGQKGALTLKTVNGNELTGDGNIEIKAGVDIINLDGLTQEERKTVYEKIDQTKLPAFIYDRATSIYSFTLSWLPEPRTIKFYTLKAEGSGMHLVLQGLESDGSITTESKSQNYVNSLFINVDNHVNDNADFECYYTGDLDYIKRSETRPNSYFILFSNGIGDSTKPVFAPVSVIWDNNNFDGNSPFRIQFTANEKLYTYLHGDADGKWLFESAKPITGVESLNGQKGALTLKTVNGNELTGDGNIEIKAGVESVNGETGNVIVKSLKYKQVSNANRKEVYDDVKAHWSDASGYTGDYVYYYQKDKDQIIFDEVKFEEDRVWFNSATLYYTSGQVHNPRMRLLCCFFNSGEEIRINENDSVVSDVNGMRYRSGNVINDGGNISFTLQQYGNGFDIYNSTNTGMHDGLFDAQFDSGIYGYKGNTPANIFTDGTDVFMAFDVVDYHYVYKMLTGTSWAFVSKTKIGGVQSSEVSNIKVLTQAEYDALTTKDENVLYCIKG